MFRNFNKLIPEMVKYSELRKIIKQRHIPIHERWECRDFKIKENFNYIKNMYNKNINNNIKIYSNKKIKYNEQYETKDF